MGFKDRLRDARKAKRYTGEQLGNSLGVTKATVSSWETGRYEPSVEQIRAICAELGVTASWLFDQAEADLPADALEEARAYATLSSEDKRKWKALRRALFLASAT